MKELSFILLGIVVGIYLIVLIGDLIISNKQKKTKIGDFREGDNCLTNTILSATVDCANDLFKI